MATKIKGEAIKESSIPLSALVPEVKDRISGIDLIDCIDNAKITIDFSNPGHHSFEEYGIDLAKSNGLLLAAMVEYLTGGGEIESVLVETINVPNHDSEYSNTQGPMYIGHTYVQYLEDYEKEFGYTIDILNKEVDIWV